MLQSGCVPNGTVFPTQCTTFGLVNSSALIGLQGIEWHWDTCSASQCTLKGAGAFGLPLDRIEIVSLSSSRLNYGLVVF